MLPRIQKQCIRALPDQRVIYLNNQKVGCSSVKANLWKAVAPDTFRPNGNVHDLEKSPFVNDLTGFEDAATARVFTFVRNPFARVLSAYLNKVVKREDGVWVGFCRRYGADADAPLEFGAFLEAISGDEPEALDPHWRPQHLNLMHPFVKPNFIGRLERMDVELPQVLERWLGVPAETAFRQSRHRTDAAAKMGEYFADPGLRGMVEKLYGPDFECFGYAPDPTAPDDGREAEFSDHSHPELALLAALQTAEKPAARREILSDLAADDAVARDAKAAAWVLNMQLGNSAVPPAERRKILRQRRDLVADGPEYLRRAAVTFCADHGYWGLCAQIAADAAKRS